MVVIDAAGQLNWNGQTIGVAGREFHGGGAGGDIVIARAGNMSGSGTILATGAAGQTNTGNDAAGGGGSGGSVVFGVRCTVTASGV